MSSIRLLPLALLWWAAAVVPLPAQSGLIKSDGTGAKPIAGPASLSAVMARYGAVLQFTPVQHALGYRVTRVNYPGSPETVVYEGSTVGFRIESHSCKTGNGQSGCIFVDTHFRTVATNLTVTYRIYAIVTGPSGRSYTLPSPPASLVWNCPDCPPLP